MEVTSFMSEALQKIELGVVANKFGPEKYRFDVFRRSCIMEISDITRIASEVKVGRWYKVRTDVVYIDKIQSYINKCRKGKVIDINDNIL